MDNKHLTTDQGAPVTDNQNSLTVGQRGPVPAAGCSGSHPALSIPPGIYHKRQDGYPPWQTKIVLDKGLRHY